MSAAPTAGVREIHRADELPRFSRWYAKEYDRQADFRDSVVSRMFDSWVASRAYGVREDGNG